MKAFIAIPLAVLLSAGASLNAQETPKETKPSAAPADPFLKEKEKKKEPGEEGPATHTNVGVVVQYIDVKRERWQQWLTENDASVDATPLRKEVETWITAGDANLAESSLVMGKSGQRAKVESVRSVPVPTHFDEDTSGQPYPSSFDPRNTGTTTEVDFVIVNEGVEINLAAERVTFAGENSPRETPGVSEGDVRHPTFGVQKVTLSSKPDRQSWALVGCENSLQSPETHQTLVFTRPLLHHFDEVDLHSELYTQGMLTWSWVEIAHDALNASLMNSSDVSAWIGGGLHEHTMKSGGRILEERSHRFESGHRSKNESLREINYPKEWDQAKIAVFARPIAFETWNIGTTVEIDPVLSAGNEILDLNMAPETTKFAGWDVFHRVLVNGEWKPNVTMPRFYTMQPTTQLSLPVDVPVLVAAMSPPDEKGWTDPSRKVLLFVKFSR